MLDDIIITPQDLPLIRKFADELRLSCIPPEFPDSFEGKLKQLYCQYFWDLIALTEEKFKILAEEEGRKMAKEFGENGK